MKKYFKCKKLNKKLKPKKITPEDGCWYVVRPLDSDFNYVCIFEDGYFYTLDRNTQEDYKMTYRSTVNVENNNVVPEVITVYSIKDLKIIKKIKL